MLAAKTRDPFYPPACRVKSRRIRRINKKKLLNRVRITGILLCLMLANILVQTLLTQTQHQLHRLQSTIKEVEKEIGRLQYDLADLSSSERIATVAVNTLGMKPAGNENYSYLAYSPPSPPETPEITLYMHASVSGGLSGGVWERVAGWLSGIGRTLAGDGY